MVFALCKLRLTDCDLNEETIYKINSGDISVKFNYFEKKKKKTAQPLEAQNLITDLADNKSTFAGVPPPLRLQGANAGCGMAEL